MPPKKKPAASVPATATITTPTTTSSSTSTTTTTTTTNGSGGSSSPSSNVKVIKWYWAGDSATGTQDTLVEYTKALNDQIEDAYQTYLTDKKDKKAKKFDVDKDRYIDFPTMTQCRKDDKSKKRTIERKEELVTATSSGSAPATLPKRELKNSKVTASKKRQIDSSSSESDSSDSSDSDSDDDEDEDYYPSWYWAGDSNGGPANGGGHQDVWVKYDLKFAKKLEESYQKGDIKLKVDKDRFIDIQNMLQRRYDDESKRRSIKREDAAKLRPTKKKSKTTTTTTTTVGGTTTTSSSSAGASAISSTASAIAAVLKCPSSWIDISMDYKEIDVYPNTKEFMWMSDLFTSTISHLHKGKSTLSPIVFNNLKVSRVVRIQNPIVWMRYHHRRQKILDDNGGKCKPVPLVITDIPNGPEVERLANEIYLFHGLNVSSIPGIAKFGFDPRFCSLEGMFGAGLYFAENSSKSNQYCHAGACTASGFQSMSCKCTANDEVCLLVCRVTLGDCLVENVFRGNTPGKFWYGRRTEPKKPDGVNIYNSVIGESKANYGPKAELQLREYIVYESSQVYPEYKVYIDLLKKLNNNNYEDYSYFIPGGCPDYPTPVPIDQNDPTIQKAYAEVDSLIQQRMEENGIKSFMATIVYGDNMVWSKAYGQVNPLDENSPPLTIDNTVRIASITKSFTDLMMFQLRDHGVIALDDPISRYYPDFTIMNPYNTKRDITFRELASHQSGLPREVPCDFDMLPNSTICSEEIILERLGKTFLILPQYTMTHYSNLGMALLGRTCGKAAKVEYETYVEEKILHPLGMKNSSFEYDAIKDRMAIGLQLYNGTYSEAPILGLGWGTPMGGLYATGRDMARYASFWLSDENDILDSSTVREAIGTTVSLVNDGSSAYGTPWETFYNEDNNVWVRMKAGALDGYRSQLAMIREYKIGVFFSAMMYISSVDLFVQDALNILLPAYNAVLLSQNAPPELPKPMLFKSHRPAPIPMGTFIGLYEYEGGYFRVREMDNALVADFGDTNLFNVTDFSADYPEIKRIQIAQPQQYNCIYCDDGSNYELVYFRVKSNDVSAVQVMGQEYQLVSKNPNVPLSEKRRRIGFVTSYKSINSFKS
ncbi:polyADP-ribose polymerase [Heterostelium album PN500]|uniref:Poly [ADP-ribose] polymerase n=1 Tax=Heterostelium pallidum (strain ATCC 26659 / Pp 5 / PN500) TaxID=670386 RepID=D3BNT4_HETP5|nr:polyADP-ribose polymerase [Heterostelium album PN500]EFA76853.1 polyADP-ribose polymerase [Heterostelium album PN500]|eukprot:XP_020428985.1 polyADP-ribose polymerase [Heterostelium album PN500]